MRAGTNGLGMELGGWVKEGGSWSLHPELAAPCERCGAPAPDGALYQVRASGGAPCKWTCRACQTILAATVPIGIARPPVWDR